MIASKLKLPVFLMHFLGVFTFRVPQEVNKTEINSTIQITCTHLIN
jgi:hypothetical protein